MMTHGWRRFKWAALPDISSAPPRYQDPGFITITGKVNIRDTKKPLFQKELFLLQVPIEDSLNSSVQFMQTDEQGKFRMDSLVFFGKTKFIVSDVQEKNKKWLDIYPDADSITTTFKLPVIDEKYFSARTIATSTSISTRLVNDYDSILMAKGKMLEGVTLTVKKKSPLQQLEERYSSGLFSGMTEKTIDLVNTAEKITQNNIFDYIQGRVAGVRIERNGLNYQLFFRQRLSLTGGPIPMILYLNEMQADAQMIATIPANQISMIKVFSSFVGAQGNGAGGVLAIYTKKGTDLGNTLSSSSGIFQYKGYSINKEFYSPDYAVNKDDVTHSSEKDRRITLHWQPDVIVDGVDTKVPIIFYNNDRTKSFKIVVEGMTSEGKMLFIEKIISPITKGF
jgi:hypothetical protein